MNKRGAMFIEYAMILAFVIAVGVAFTSSSVIPKAINDIFGNAGEMLQLAANDQRKLGSVDGFIQALLNDKTSFKIKDTNTDENVPKRGDPVNHETAYTSIIDFLTSNTFSDCQIDSENPSATRYHTVYDNLDPEKADKKNLKSAITESLIQSGYIDSKDFMWGIDKRAANGTRTMWITDVRPADGWDTKNPVIAREYSIGKDGSITLINDAKEKKVTQKTKTSAETDKPVTYYSFF